MADPILEEINKKLDLLLKRQGKECNCEVHNSSEDSEWSCPVHGYRWKIDSPDINFVREYQGDLK
jgi:hypothetical protein